MAGFKNLVLKRDFTLMESSWKILQFRPKPPHLSIEAGEKKICPLLITNDPIIQTTYFPGIVFSAIENGLGRVEAGTQGPHKVQRGYLPVDTFSAHWIADPGLREPVRDFVRREARQVLREKDSMLDASPYRRDSP